MTRYKVIIEYDGTNLIGWQANKDGPSVQSILEESIFKFSSQHVDLTAAGRTDAGVHALGMAVHFDLSGDEVFEPDTVMRALNFYLNEFPVSVLSAEIVPDDFNARFSCVRRNYRYIILNRRAPVSIDKGKVWWVPRKLDMGKIKSAAEKMIGNHDFTSFRAVQCQAKSPIKTLDSITISELPDSDAESKYIFFDFSARSFLHHQVRNMMGTLIEIGLGKPYDIDEIFNAKDRSAAGPTAPADGLYFVSAEYL